MSAATDVVLRLIRQRHEVVGVVLEKMIEAPANHLNANRLGGSMKNGIPRLPVMKDCSSIVTVRKRPIMRTRKLTLAIHILTSILILSSAFKAHSAGVTIITHGFGSGTSDWVQDMANSIAQRAGGTDKVVIYNLKVTAYYSQLTGDVGFPYISGITNVSGPPMWSGTHNAEAIIKVDWSDVDSIPIPLFSNPLVPAEYIGQVVAAFLLTNQFTSHNLLELPIHLVGHSRGASVNSTLAQKLAEAGIWVDQMTTLDPHPVSGFGDAPVQCWTNILFADNWYRTGIGGPDGSSLSGAKNANLSGIVTGTILTSEAHTRVHTFYHGTIETNAASVDSQNIVSNWYAYTDPGVNPLTGPRNQVGYGWSRIAGGTMDGGTRPAGGLKLSGAPRVPVTISATGADVWDNIEITGFANDQTWPQGSYWGVTGYFEDFNQDATIVIGLDSDSNPYNGVVKNLYTNATSAIAGNFFQTAFNPNQIPPGGAYYYAYAKVSNGTHTRYYYPRGRLAVGEVTTNWKRWTNTVGGFFSTASNWAGNSVPSQSDVALFDLPNSYTVTAAPNNLVTVYPHLDRLVLLNGTVTTFLTNTLTIGNTSTSIPSITIGGPGGVSTACLDIEKGWMSGRRLKIWENGHLIATNGLLYCRQGEITGGKVTVGTNAAGQRAGGLVLGDDDFFAAGYNTWGPKTWTPGGLDVGRNAVLLLQSGAEVNVVSVVVGGHSGHNGTLIVASEAELHCASSWIGSSSGNGLLTVTSGGHLTIDNYLYVGQSGTGTVLVSNATVLIPGYIKVGSNSGTGNVVVAKGAEFRTSHAWVGDGGTGFVSVTDNNSRWICNGQFWVYGELSISNKADLTLQASPYSVKFYSGAKLRLSDASITSDTTVENNGTFFVTRRGILNGSLDNYGRIEFSKLEGALSVDGYFYSGEANSVISAALGSSAQMLINVSGTAYLGGQLIVSFTNNFLPGVGIPVELIRAASVSGQFQSTVLPSLPAGQFWDVQYDSTNVVITRIDPNAPPRLSIFPQNGNVAISWHTSAVGYVLQSLTQLGTTNWMQVSNVPSVVGNQKVITNAVNGSQNFYRLMK